MWQSTCLLTAAFFGCFFSAFMWDIFLPAQCLRKGIPLHWLTAALNSQCLYSPSTCNASFLPFVIIFTCQSDSIHHVFYILQNKWHIDKITTDTRISICVYPWRTLHWQKNDMAEPIQPMLIRKIAYTALVPQCLCSESFNWSLVTSLF